MAKAKVNIEPKAIKATFDSANLEAMNVSFIALGRLVRTKLSQPGTGRIYRVSRGRGRGARNLRAAGFHRASAAGFPPAVNTNRLRASFISDQLGQWKYGFARVDQTETKTILNYGSRVTYAPMLEYGTRRMRARPYLRPTVDVFRKQVGRIFGVAYRRWFGPQSPAGGGK